MNSNYFKNLQTQFFSAKGYTQFGDLTGSLNDEFDIWISNMENNIKTYRKILNDLSINYNSSECVEIGKGSIDTIVKPNELIYLKTPYDLSFENNKDYNFVKNESDKQFNSFFTHNPYIISDIAKYRKIVKNRYGVCVGVFGNNSDEDRKRKIKEIKLLKATFLIDGLDDLIKEFDMVIDDQYFDILSIEPQKLIKK